MSKSMHTQSLNVHLYLSLSANMGVYFILYKNNVILTTLISQFFFILLSSIVEFLDSPPPNSKRNTQRVPVCVCVRVCFPQRERVSERVGERERENVFYFDASFVLQSDNSHTKHENLYREYTDVKE